MATYAPFHVTIANVEGSLYDGEVTELHVPGVMGQMTILAHHEPLIALLGGGTVIVSDSQGEALTKLTITGGLLEVSHNRAIVLI